MDKGIDTEPLIVILHYHGRTVHIEDLNPTRDLLESNEVFVEDPQFDRPLRRGLLHLPESL
jgi:hypothetical protein